MNNKIVKRMLASIQAAQRLLGLAVIFGVLVPVQARAASPWENAVDVLERAFTGPIARGLSLVSPYGNLTVSGVRRLLDSAAGVLRSGAGLEEALTRLEEGAVSGAAADASDVAAMICSAALARPQSLGAHQRLDGPALIAV